jgi:hypothetical protein
MPLGDFWDGILLLVNHHVHAHGARGLLFRDVRLDELPDGEPAGAPADLPGTVKKGYRFSRPQPGCHQPNSPWPGIIK